eukprot:TRINITY_DN23670_c0_g1_i1.p1 TRINITY_DN23670_c0_g1~~TRINITY_DN23670_c0_g1_i1.p1  ORF type:complete len:376 (+),score=54.65 TRINITY_DN23670_c0_g1_i1:285-1412(+)
MAGCVLQLSSRGYKSARVMFDEPAARPPHLSFGPFSAGSNCNNEKARKRLRGPLMEVSKGDVSKTAVSSAPGLISSGFRGASSGQVDSPSLFRSGKIPSPGDGFWKGGCSLNSSGPQAEISGDGEGEVILPAIESDNSGRRESHSSHGGALGSPSALKGPKACAQCGNTKTPLWRNGPPGPKSLCNACGIRFNKMKSGKRSRAQMAADELIFGKITFEPATPKETPAYSPDPYPLWCAKEGSGTPSRKRSRTLYSKAPLPSPLKQEDASSGDDAAGSPTSSASSSGGSCVTRKGRTMFSPPGALACLSPPSDVARPPIFSFNSDVSELITSSPDKCPQTSLRQSGPSACKEEGENEGAELLMALMFGPNWSRNPR